MLHGQDKENLKVIEPLLSYIMVKRLFLYTDLQKMMAIICVKMKKSLSRTCLDFYCPCQRIFLGNC